MNIEHLTNDQSCVSVPWADRRKAALFLALVMFLSAPALLLSFWFDWQPIPGVPASAIIAVLCPVAAALALSYIEGGRAMVFALLARGDDLDRLPSRWWIGGLLLLHPSMLLLHYGILTFAGGTLPPLSLAPSHIAILFALFLIPAWGEEMGWTGYVTAPLRNSLGAVGAAITLGAVQAAWHVGALISVGRDLGWILWWALGTILGRILFMWLYERGGHSVAAAILFHAGSNVAWQLFPIAGSYYDPRIGSLLVCVIALPAAVDLYRNKRR